MYRDYLLMAIIISPQVLSKLANKTPPVTKREVEQCFDNRVGGLLFDTREDHKTNPPTQWFIAQTNSNRELKIVFMQKGLNVVIKTAYDPNVDERFIYEKYGN